MYFAQIEVLHWLEKTDNIGLVLSVAANVALWAMYKKKDNQSLKLTENLKDLSTQTATVMTSMSKTIEYFATEQSKGEARIIDKVDECFDRLREGVNNLKSIVAKTEFHKDEKGTKENA